MHLKSLKLKNFRKFGSDGNVVEFVASKQGTQKPPESISNATTLIVGKNNAGKTTITQALNKLVNNSIKAADFNYHQLNKLFDLYKAADYKELPTIEFELVIVVNSDNTDSIAHVGDFLSISSSSIDEDEIHINLRIRYAPKESQIFKDAVAHLIAKYKDSERSFVFAKFIDLIDDSEFRMSYYNSEDEPVENAKFKISELLSIKLISADKNLKDSILAKTFNSLIKTRYALPSNSKSLESLDVRINEINAEITSNIQVSHSKSINDVLHQIESANHLGVQLSSDLNFDRLMQNLIKYEYTELGQTIPEGQFGLGYANLMSIIGEIIDYVETYPDEEKHSRIHLICIEEPENYMHPQMQELFISRVDRAVNLLLSNSGKNINSQLIITTHSSHILNSKIHASNSFNNINYLTVLNNHTHVVRLNDRVVMDDEPIPEGMEKEVTEQRLNDLKFLKKHIKFKVSDLFFSDAVIIVEGITEETLLPYYLEKQDELKKYYISIFNINGAHGKVYRPLIKLLKIPVLLITDIDIKRNENDKNNHTQLTSLSDATTTNETIKEFNGNSENISSITSYFSKENLFCIFQKDPIEGQHATSFEEALILSNYKNDILNSAIKKVKPGIYAGIVNAEGKQEFEKLISNSYQLQQKLSDSKSDFANTLLYQIIVADQTIIIPKLPKYINDGFDWLNSALNPKVAMQASNSEEVAP